MSNNMKNIRVSVLFVCLGNICRSPTAHAVFRQLVDDENLNEFITVDSAGTGDWHIGCPPDKDRVRQPVKGVTIYLICAQGL